MLQWMHAHSLLVLVGGRPTLPPRCSPAGATRGDALQATHVEQSHMRCRMLHAHACENVMLWQHVEWPTTNEPAWCVCGMGALPAAWGSQPIALSGTSTLAKSSNNIQHCEEKSLMMHHLESATQPAAAACRSAGWGQGAMVAHQVWWVTCQGGRELVTVLRSRW